MLQFEKLVTIILNYEKRIKKRRKYYDKENRE